MALFPDPSLEYEEGLVGVGGQLDISVLLEAYSKGIFPWPQEGYPMLWFCPEERGILHFNKFKIPTSLKKKMKGYSHLQFTKNKNFEGVIKACAEQKRLNQAGTWISDEIVKAYIEFHQAGYAHSWEVWDAGELVGGGYGVFCLGVFAGESLFHKKTNMSKLALIHMVEDLKNQGLTWMDTQMVTPLLEAFGAEQVRKKEYLELLARTQKKYKLVP
jgi:leucyl/phenylalanyl-tRNA---protein transferase